MEHYTKWYGETRKPHYGSVMAARRAGRPEVESDLIRLAEDPLLPSIVRATALELLRAKAIRRGAVPENLEMEVIEAYQFNMIRGFRTIGKNIRVRVQVKPGLIKRN